jgi:PAS domain S-box-containing protein
MPPRELVTPLGQLEAVCDNATVALFIMDERHHCIYMNPAAVRMTGFTLPEVQGAPMHEFVHHHHPDGRPFPIAECPIDGAAPKGNQEQGEAMLVRKDGTFFPVAFTASPIHRDARVVGTVVEMRDISVDRQRDAEREATRGIAELILGELDLGRIVQAVTDTATRLTGAQFGAFFYNVSDRKGGSYMLYTLSGVDRETFANFPMPRATPMFGPTFRGEGTVRIGDVHRDPRYGQWAPYHGMPEGHLPVRSYLAVPVLSDQGHVLGGLFFGHERADVFSADHASLVESLAAQAAIGVSRAQLFREVEEARDIARAEAAEKELLYQEATRVSRMKDEFLATVSHELRTPLTSILGWSEMLASGRLPDAMVGQAVATIARNARAQSNIIEDLLDVSRIIGGKLSLDVRVISPATAMQAAIEAARPAALARDVSLTLHADPDAGPVSADPDRLQQVFWNLLSNAVKFTGRGGRVDVRIERDGSEVRIGVRDTGRGIAPEFLPHLFERFSQFDASPTREHGGLGLGLAIVRQLVEMQGGAVAASSEGLGTGAEFIVRLPLAPLTRATRDVGLVQEKPGASRATEWAGGVDLRGCRVLLVEDDTDSRELIASVLRHERSDVRAFASAVEALAAIEEFRPTVVVSDIGMPQMDGYAFIRAMRDREHATGAPRVPAIALTAFARSEDQARALEAGFERHVAKPVQPGELLAIVASLRERSPVSGDA